MFNEYAISLINQIARAGVDDVTNELLIDLFDTILSTEDFSSIHLVNIQTLLLLLCDEKLPLQVRRLLDETRYRIIRISLGRHWRNGAVVNSQVVFTKNRNMTILEEKIDSYENGFIVSTPVNSLQPDIVLENNVLNDLAIFTFGEK